MKKILSVFLVYLLSASISFAKDLRFVQVTDVRFSEKSENNILKKIVDDINKQKDVEFVVFTGDNINKPDKKELSAFLSEAKKLNCPFYLVIGDRDVNKHKDLSKKEYIKTIKKEVRRYRPETPSYTFEKDGVVFIVADGSKDVIPGTMGYFKEDVLSWMDSELSLYPDNNVIILQHFPVIPPAEKETYYTFKPENYLKVIAKHSNVKAVIAGHFGVNKEETVNGVLHISTAPAPYYRIIDILDSETKNPTIWAQLKEVE